MNKTLLIALALAGGAFTALAAEPTPYFTELGADAAWTAYDVNQDAHTWESTTDGTANSIKYKWNTTQPADDWYIGPAIHLEGGKEYKVKVWHKTGAGYAERYRINYSAGSTVADLVAGHEVYSGEVKVGSWTQNIRLFTPTATGDYHFGIQCWSEKDKMNLFLTGLSIAENRFFPGTVTGLTVTPGADRALTATLSWTLPTADADGLPLPDGAAFDAVTVYRDGVEVALLDGTDTTWTDDASRGLTSGYHKYSVTVTVNGSDSAEASVNSPYIGPIEACALPYDVDFPNMNQEKFELFWTPVKGRNATTANNWEYNATSYYGNRFKFYPQSGKQEDNWLISPQMKFTEPGAYKVTLGMEYTSNTKAGITLLLGQGTAIGGYETEIGKITKFDTSKQTFTFYFSVDTPGEYGIAVHNDNLCDTYSTYYINDFRVEATRVVPLHVTDLAATVNDDASVTLTWTNPTESNIGTPVDALDKVEVYCNGDLAHTLTDATPGGASSHVHFPATAGVHTYHVLPYNAEGAPEGAPVAVTTGWVGDETQPLPYTTEFSSTDVTRPIWSSCDANADGRTWRIGTSAKMDLDKSVSSYRNDDYLLAPYMDFKAGHYNVTLNLKGGAVNKTFGIGIVADKSDVAATYTRLADLKQTATYTVVYTIPVTIAEAGRYALAIRNNDLTVPSGENADEIVKFKVEYVPVVPEPATGLTITPDPSLALAADIAWTNPTATNIEGVAADITKAVILRDGVEVGEVSEGLLPGATSQWRDTELPSAGHYTYSVVIYGQEGCSAKAAPSVKSPWIGGGLDTPWINELDFDRSDWTIHNVNGDKRSIDGSDITWEVNSSYINITSNTNTPDDWAISPRLTFEAGETYVIEIHSYTGSGYEPVSWDVHFGAGTLHTDMDPVALKTIRTTAELRKDAQTDIIRVKAVGADASAPRRITPDDPALETAAVEVPAGVGTIGLHANNKGSVSVSHFNVYNEIMTGVDDVVAQGITVTADCARFAVKATRAILCDMSGRTLREVREADTMALTGLPAGVYVLKARFGDQTQSIKIIR